MIISLIAAVAKNGVIGQANDLPWHLPDDMKYFMQTTKNHHVIMGRKNYDSLPERFKPLPNRVNMVLTHKRDFLAPGCLIIHDFEEGIELAKEEKELFVIGGAELYALSLAKADRLYLTEINAEVKGDTIFPSWDKKNWEEISRQHHSIDDRHRFSFDFVVYNRKG